VASDLRQVWADPENCGRGDLLRNESAPRSGYGGGESRQAHVCGKAAWDHGKGKRGDGRGHRNAKVRFTTGYFMRTDPKHLFLKDQIARGNFGKITRVRGSNCHAGSWGVWFDGEYRWMADPKVAGVGAFGDLGTHKLDILMWLLGEVEAVTAEIKSVTARYGDCDETGEALIRFKNGVIGTLAAGWVDIEDPVQLEISGTEAMRFISDKPSFTIAARKCRGRTARTLHQSCRLPLERRCISLLTPWLARKICRWFLRWKPPHG